MDTGLAGKGVLVTGASGGIGAACARAFAGEGARVVVHYHRGEARAREVAASLGGAPVVQADLTDEHEIDRLFAEARAALGRIDVCAAVAGVWPAEDLPVWGLPLERWEETVRQNLTTTFLTARAFLREVARNNHGSLVLVGSTAGLVGEAGPCGLRRREVGDPRRALAQPQERDRPDRADGARERCGARLDGVADDARPRRSRGDPPDLAHDGAAQGRAARRRRATGRRPGLDTLSGHVTGQVVTVAGGMEGRVVHE